MCVVCVSIKRLKRVARRAVWVSSRVHAWRGASRLMHARHTRVRVPHSSLLPCTEPPELRVPRRLSDAQIWDVAQPKNLRRAPSGERPAPSASPATGRAVGVCLWPARRSWRRAHVAPRSAQQPRPPRSPCPNPRPTHGRAPSSPRHRVPPPHTVYKNHDKHSQSAQTPLDPY